MLSHDRLCRLIPHAGTMCLLERVVAWDAQSITCHSSSHRDPHNPLRRDGRLAAICAVEYAAQAMAVHGGLLRSAEDGPTQGYLAALRGVSLHAETLHQLDDELIIHAERLGGDAAGFIYNFSVTSSTGQALVEGRATVFNESRETIQ